MLVLDEGLGAVDGAVDVALGGEVHDGARAVLGEEARDELRASQMSPWTKM